MPTWIWILLCILFVAAGAFAMALIQIGSRSDDWMDGYWAARRDMERERKKREGGGE
jgi:phosphatidylglycerophosphate synthase